MRLSLDAEPQRAAQKGDKRSSRDRDPEGYNSTTSAARGCEIGTRLLRQCEVARYGLDFFGKAKLRDRCFLDTLSRIPSALPAFPHETLELTLCRILTCFMRALI